MLLMSGSYQRHQMLLQPGLYCSQMPLSLINKRVWLISNIVYYVCYIKQRPWPIWGSQEIVKTTNLKPHTVCEPVWSLSFCQFNINSCFLRPCTPSGAEALPPAWNECYGVHQSYPYPENQSGTRLCTEGTDQRTGKVPSKYQWGLCLHYKFIHLPVQYLKTSILEKLNFSFFELL